MALVQFGGGVSAMAGRVGGTVFSRNKGGAYARNWAKPTNEPTAIQTTRRAAFASLSAMWSALPEGSREVWAGDAGGMTLKNRLGDDYIPSGRQYFMSVNQNLQLTSQTLIDLPPTGSVPPIIDDLATLVAEETANVLASFTLELTDWTTDSILIVQAAPPQTGGKNNLILLYRQILSIAADASIDLTAAYDAVFGDFFPDAGIIRLRIRAVGFETGLSSPWLIVQGTIVPA